MRFAAANMRDLITEDQHPVAQFLQSLTIELAETEALLQKPEDNIRFACV